MKKTYPFPFFHVLTAVLIVLKLMHKIDISWWWVFSPFAVFVALVVIGEVCDTLSKDK